MVELVWEYFGSKSVYLVKAIKVKFNSGNLKRFYEEIPNISIGQIELMLGRMRLSEDLDIGNTLKISSSS